jgi:hypothetical protein
MTFFVLCKQAGYFEHYFGNITANSLPKKTAFVTAYRQRVHIEKTANIPIPDEHIAMPSLLR